MIHKLREITREKRTKRNGREGREKKGREPKESNTYLFRRKGKENERR